MLSDDVKQRPAVAALLERDPDAIVEGRLALGETTLVIDPARIVETCRFYKNEQSFIRLCSVTAVDWHPVEPRFEVVYQLHSLDRNERLRLKCRVHGDAPEIDSVCQVWRGAEWYEREVFDLFGIAFRNHPDMTRIMMPEGWEGHPLRRDYPVHGHKYDYSSEN